MAFDERAPQPDDSRYERNLVGFCNDISKQAELTVSSCEGHGRIQDTWQAIMGANTIPAPKESSSTKINEVGRVFEIGWAHLTDVKPTVAFRTHNAEFEGHAEDYTKLWQIWYYNRAIDAKYSATVAYSLACASGYAHQVWNKRINDIDVAAYDGRDWRPVDPFDTTVQSCWGMDGVRAVPLTWAQAMFPHKAEELRRDVVIESPARVPEATNEALVGGRPIASPFWSQHTESRASEKRGKGIEVVYLHWLYYNDPTRNDSSSAKYMGDFDEAGEPLTNYSYIVEPGQALYPRKRLTVYTKSTLCYDGPSHNWHGMFPVSKYTMTPLPNTWLGHTPMWDTLSPQETITRVLRVMDNQLRKLQRPPVRGGRSSDEEELRKLSEMLINPGAFFRDTGGSSDPIKIEQVQALDQTAMVLLEFCIRKIADRVGIEDMSGIAKAAQLPSDATIDKLLFASSPTTRWRSRMFELFYREQGRMFLFNAAQHYPVRRKFKMIGRASMKPTDYDYNPATFVPHLHDTKGRHPADVAADHFDNFDFYVEPSSLLHAAAQGRKAEDLALFRLGALDIESLLEGMDKPNITKIMERLEKQWETKMKLAAMANEPQGGADGGDGPPMPPLGGDPRGRKAEGTDPARVTSEGYVSQSR